MDDLLFITSKLIRLSNDNQLCDKKTPSQTAKTYFKSGSGPTRIMS